MPRHREFEHEYDETGKQLPLPDGSHKVLNWIIRVVTGFGAIWIGGMF